MQPLDTQLWESTPPPLYCTSSSPSQQAHSEPFLGTVIIVIYVDEERHAPISSLCDTASELVSLLLIACNIPALLTSPFSLPLF